MNPRHAAALALVCTLILPSLAKADSAEELLSGCKSIADSKVEGDHVRFPTAYTTGQCWGAFAVLQEEYRWAYASQQRTFGACVPPDATRSELIAVFVAYVQRHPERRHDDFVAVANDAARAAYPCAPAK